MSRKEAGELRKVLDAGNLKKTVSYANDLGATPAEVVNAILSIWFRAFEKTSIDPKKEFPCVICFSVGELTRDEKDCGE